MTTEIEFFCFVFHTIIIQRSDFSNDEFGRLSHILLYYFLNRNSWTASYFYLYVKYVNIMEFLVLVKGLNLKILIFRYITICLYELLRKIIAILASIIGTFYLSSLIRLLNSAGLV